MDTPRSQMQAVALRYRPSDDDAPKVAAKGRGFVAQRILELAKTHGIPIREDKTLVQVLSLLDLDQEIPNSVYKAVAEILAFVYQQSRGPQLPPELGRAGGDGRAR